MPNITGLSQQPIQSYVPRLAQANPTPQPAQTQQPAAPKVSTEKGSSGNGVVINIYNPVGSKNGGTDPAPPTPTPEPVQQPAPVALPQPAPLAAQNLDKSAEPPQVAPPAQPKSPQPSRAIPSDLPKNSPPPLTNEFVMQLDKDLNEPELKKRKAASFKVYRSFKEDSSRKNDPALTALLNRGLQYSNDPAIVSTMLMVLDKGYATGDAKTDKILLDIQNKETTEDLPTVANEEQKVQAEVAQRILERKAQQKSEIEQSSSQQSMNSLSPYQSRQNQSYSTYPYQQGKSLPYQQPSIGRNLNIINNQNYMPQNLPQQNGRNLNLISQ